LTIRAGAFATEEEAKALAGRLAASKIESRIVPFQTAEGTTLYLVLAGSYATRPEALAEMSQIEQKEGVTGAVVPLPPP
jgi:cell division septation protein DedD